MLHVCSKWWKISSYWDQTEGCWLSYQCSATELWPLDNCSAWGRGVRWAQSTRRMKAQILNLLQTRQSDLSQRKRKVKNKDGKERGEKMTVTQGGTHGVMNASVDHSIYIGLCTHSCSSAVIAQGAHCQGFWACLHKVCGNQRCNKCPCYRPCYWYNTGRTYFLPFLLSVRPRKGYDKTGYLGNTTIENP